MPKNCRALREGREIEPAEIARDRSLQKTKGEYNVRGTSYTKNVSLHDRINQFPDQLLIVRGTKILCEVCKEILSSKKSVIKLHCASLKHVRSKERSKKSKLKEQTIAEALSREKTRQDSTLPLAQQAYRQEVVKEFLKAGIPISKIDKLRSLLEKNGHRLTSSSNLAQYITLIFKQEVDTIKKELSLPGQGDMTRDVSVIFDGSTRQGEAIAIIVRFIDDQWAITQRLIRIDVCSKSVNADELARVLNEALCVEFGIRANSLLAAMRDGASVNQAALNRIQFFFPKMLNIVCFSHTLDNVGSHLVTPTLQEFGNLWVRLFHSYRAKLAWKDLTGRKPKSYSETRWWSKWEVYKQLLEQFGDVPRFLQEAATEKIDPNIVRQLQDLLSDPESLVNLKLELAVTIDVGEHFVKATYFLEGDGPLVFSCYEKLKAVAEACQAPYFPNVRAVVAAIVNEDPNQRAAALEQRAKACVQPAIQRFLRKFNVDLYDAVTAFKAARVMCPVTVGWLRPTRASVEALRIFPFLDNDATIDGLVRELPQYITATQDVAIECEGRKVEWWKVHEERLPNWSSAVKKVLLVQPSSAAAERVFSLLSASFHEQQENALSDYLQASVMLQYNNRR